VSMSIKLEQYDGWDIVVIKGAMMISKLRHDPPIFGVLGDKPGTHVALDLSETLAIDSGALSVLLTLERRLRMNGGSLVVLSPSEEIRVLFGIVGFDDRIQILDSRREFEAYTHRISR
jgi:anti-anti-sigma factor